MKYPIAIEKEDGDTAFGVTVPDLPGCFSAGDTLDEALDNAREAIELWLETVIDDGGVIPAASSLDVIRQNPEHNGAVFAIVQIDIAKLSDKTERINITLPSRVLRRIDRDASKSGESRSGFIARKMLSA